LPNNIEGRGLTDREMLQLCLELEKGRCRSLSNTVLEATHDELRDIYMDCLGNAENNQFLLFDYMKKKGWYKVPNATLEQIGEVQALMQNNLHPDNQF
jgi:spore coat protein CotF